MDRGKKRKLLYFICSIVVISFISLATLALLHKKEKKQDHLSQSVVLEKKKSEEIIETDPNKNNYKKLESRLENPYGDVTEEEKQDVISTLKSAENYMAEFDPKNMLDLKGNSDNHLALTAQSAVQTFCISIKINGYRIDESETIVKKTNNDDVLQVVFCFKKDGVENNYWIANYNSTVKQFELVQYQGGVIGELYK